MLKERLYKLANFLIHHGSDEHGEYTVKLPTLNEHPIKESPYRYIVIDDFFSDSFYGKLCHEFQQVLNLGLSESNTKHKFSKFEGYDAYSFTPDPHAGGVINLLRTTQWRDYFANTFGLELTNDEIMALHHHKTESKDGWNHNDYCSCSFVDEPLSSGINPWYYQCIYEDSTNDRQPETKKVMRAVTIIYYLNNDCDGKFGGGTAIYNQDGTITEVIEPKNNRLLAFEVSPVSFHGFLSNTKYPRNTITQWFHQDVNKMMKRFNNSPHVQW